MTGFVVRSQMLIIAAGWVALGVPVFGQGVAADAKPLAYDVVSVKPNKSGLGMMRIMNQPERFSMTNMGLKMVIQNAYGLKMPDMISGLPGWADSAAFDIEAKMDAETIAALKAMPKEQADEQRRLMMQAMLADRFKLKVHHETKELPIYSLVIAKGGFKLKDADPNSTYPGGIKGPDGVSRPGMMRMGGGKLTAQGIAISGLSNFLSQQVHRLVVDNTGLTGKYDISLQWTPDEVANAHQEAGATGTTDSGPSIYTALQEQLGLRLDSTKGPVETVVVDHVEMPSEN
jgi:uncharacterized protein (TIGR03435 family)